MIQRILPEMRESSDSSGNDVCFFTSDLLMLKLPEIGIIFFLKGVQLGEF
jgi:hypothetical protein